MYVPSTTTGITIRGLKYPADAVDRDPNALSCLLPCSKTTNVFEMGGARSGTPWTCEGPRGA